MTGQENTKARIGIYGKAGSGKTRTGMEIAIGLALALGDKAPIAMIDTEGNGIDHMAPIVKAAGLELLGIKTRDFRTAVEAMWEAESVPCSVIMVDSASHLWGDVIEAYLQSHGADSLSVSDWGPIKRTWRPFPEAFLTVQAHTIVCGRAAGVYEMEKDDRGKWEVRQVDTKMRAEGELEHEPSLLLEMDLIPRRKLTGDPNAKGYVNRATILKDRTDTMNGHEIQMPTFASFAPILRQLSPGAHVAMDKTAVPGALLGSSDWAKARDDARKKALVTRLQDLFELHGISEDSDEHRRIRADLFSKHLGHPTAKEAFKALAVYQLEEGVRNMERAMEPPEPATAPAGQTTPCRECEGGGRIADASRAEGWRTCPVCLGTGSPDVQPTSDPEAWRGGTDRTPAGNSTPAQGPGGSSTRNPDGEPAAGDTGAEQGTMFPGGHPSDEDR
jgi:hypothetical protein